MGVSNYNLINWVNGIAGGKPLNAANLNQMDEGIDHANAILSDIDPIDIILFAGQSNNEPGGWATVVGNVPFVDIVDPAFCRYQGSAWQTMPLMNNATVNENEWLGSSALREYRKQHLGTNRRVGYVELSMGGKAFDSSYPDTWDRTKGSNTLYHKMIAGGLAALAAAPAGSRIVAIVWVQGEMDATANWTESQYATKLDDLIAQARIDLNIANLPFLIGGMVPEWIGSGASGTSVAIDLAHKKTPNRVLYTAFTPGPVGLADVWSNDFIHFSAEANLVRGKEIMESLLRARLNYGSIEPTAPFRVRVARSGNQTIFDWDPSTTRATSYSLRTSTNYGSSWTTVTRAEPMLTYETVTSPAAAETPIWGQVLSNNANGTSYWSTIAKA